MKNFTLEKAIYDSGFYKNGNKIIAIEGLDGSGKTTLSYELGKLCDKAIYPVDCVNLKFPSRKPSDDFLKGATLSEIADFYYEILEEDNEKIKNYIKQKKQKIILDRSYFTTIAYMQAMGYQDMKNLVDKIMSKLYKIDIVYYLKIDVNMCLQRIKYRKKHIDFYEKKELLAKVSLAYKELINKYNFVVI